MEDTQTIEPQDTQQTQQTAPVETTAPENRKGVLGYVHDTAEAIIDAIPSWPGDIIQAIAHTKGYHNARDAKYYYGEQLREENTKRELANQELRQQIEFGKTAEKRANAASLRAEEAWNFQKQETEDARVREKISEAEEYAQQMTDLVLGGNGQVQQNGAGGAQRKGGIGSFTDKNQNYVKTSPAAVNYNYFKRAMYMFDAVMKDASNGGSFNSELANKAHDIMHGLGYEVEYRPSDDGKSGEFYITDEQGYELPLTNEKIAEIEESLKSQLNDVVYETSQYDVNCYGGSMRYEGNMAAESILEKYGVTVDESRNIVNELAAGKWTENDRFQTNLALVYDQYKGSLTSGDLNVNEIGMLTEAREYLVQKGCYVSDDGNKIVDILGSFGQRNKEYTMEDFAEHCKNNPLYRRLDNIIKQAQAVQNSEFEMAMLKRAKLEADVLNAQQRAAGVSVGGTGGVSGGRASSRRNTREESQEDAQTDPGRNEDGSVNAEWLYNVNNENDVFQYTDTKTNEKVYDAIDKPLSHLGNTIFGTKNKRYSEEEIRRGCMHDFSTYQEVLKKQEQESRARKEIKDKTVRDATIAPVTNIKDSMEKVIDNYVLDNRLKDKDFMKELNDLSDQISNLVNEQKKEDELRKDPMRRGIGRDYSRNIKKLREKREKLYEVTPEQRLKAAEDIAEIQRKNKKSKEEK